MTDESDLIVRAQHGEIPAYESLVRTYEQIAFRVAYLITHDEHEAADAAQEAFVRAFRSLASFNPNLPFRPWLLRIVTNLALNRIKLAQRREAMTKRYARHVMMNEQNPSPEQTVIERMQNQRIVQAVRQMSPEDQTLISLRYFLELPEAEVAQAMSIPLGTVKSRLYRTLARLREIIVRDFPDLQSVVR
ncbi:MAG: RNA polymerase sigma factor [Chloroflexi bacterium]|nr:RNA polymerase sigma factor [Chloroflexota bacterium]